MMFIVQADVVAQDIQGAIVRIRLRGRSQTRCFLRPFVRWRGEDVVFGDEVGGAGVERSGEEARCEEVVYRVQAAGLVDGEVEEELGEDVQAVNGGEGEAVDEDGTDGVEEDLEGAEEGFS